MKVIIVNKKLEQYLSKSFKLSDDLIFEHYRGRWIYFNDIIIPHISNDDFEGFFFAGESILMTEKDLEENKIYFVNDFEGIFTKEEVALTKLRVAYELSPTEYFVVLKDNKFFGVLYKNSPLLDLVNYIMLETNKKPKFKVNADRFEMKKKFVHILKMSNIEIDEEMFFRLDEIIK